MKLILWQSFTCSKNQDFGFYGRAHPDQCIPINPSSQTGSGFISQCSFTVLRIDSIAGLEPAKTGLEYLDNLSEDAGSVDPSVHPSVVVPDKVLRAVPHCVYQVQVVPASHLRKDDVVLFEFRLFGHRLADNVLMRLQNGCHRVSDSCHPSGFPVHQVLGRNPVLSSMKRIISHNCDVIFVLTCREPKCIMQESNPLALF